MLVMNDLDTLGVATKTAPKKNYAISYPACLPWCLLSYLLSSSSSLVSSSSASWPKVDITSFNRVWTLPIFLCTYVVRTCLKPSISYWQRMSRNKTLCDPTRVSLIVRMYLQRDEILRGLIMGRKRCFRACGLPLRILRISLTRLG